MTSVRLLLLRHGLTVAGHHIFLGSESDSALSAEGQRQVASCAVEFRERRITTLVVSPLLRAQETAQIVAPELPGRIDVRLREIDYGVFSGMTMAEIERDYPALLEGWRLRGESPSGAEPLSALFRRTAAAALDALAHVNEDQDLLFVTHNGPIRALVAAARYPTPGAREWRRIRTAHARLRVVRITPLVVTRWQELVSSVE